MTRLGFGAYLVALLTCVSLPARAYELEWSRTYGLGEASSVARTHDGGFITSGYAGSDVSAQFRVMKLTSTGSVEWDRTYAGSDAKEVIQLSDGGYLAVGVSYDQTAVTMLALRLDQAGDTLWSRNLGSGIAWSAIETGSGELVIAMDGASTALAKLASDGTTVWTKGYGNAGSEIYSVIENSSGGYILAGARRVGTAPTDGVLISVDALGDSTWTHSFGGTGWDRLYAVQRTAGGDLVATGMRNGYQLWVVRTLDNGQLVLDRSFDGGHVGYGLLERTGGGLVVAGASQDFDQGTFDACLFSLDAAGDSSAIATFGTLAKDERAMSIDHVPGGSLVVAGYVDCQPGHIGCSEPDYWISVWHQPALSGVPSLSSNAGELRLTLLSSNPTRQSVKLKYSLPRHQRGQISIHDIAGRLLHRVDIEESPWEREGVAVITLPDLKVGGYVARLSSGGADTRVKFQVVR